MKHGYCQTREERRQHHVLLAELFRKWKKLTTPELREEVKKLMPNIADDDEDRDSMIQFLVMNHVEKMI